MGHISFFPHFVIQSDYFQELFYPPSTYEILSKNHVYVCFEVKRKGHRSPKEFGSAAPPKQQCH